MLTFTPNGVAFSVGITANKRRQKTVSKSFVWNVQN